MKPVTLALLTLFLLNLATIFYCYRSTPKKEASAGFVNVIQLINNYKLKQDLSKQVDGKLKTDQNLIDSLNLRLKLTKPNSGEQELANQNLMAAKYQYENEAEAFNRSISQQVWDRLNPLIYDFSRANNISLLVGATGTGNVLYGDSTLDYTSKLTKYINERYDGK